VRGRQICPQGYTRLKGKFEFKISETMAMDRLHVVLVFCMVGFAVSSPVRIEFQSNHTVQVTLPDNSTETVHLAPTTKLPSGSPTTPCLFSGKLGSDPHSLIVVHGCHDSKELEVSIASKKIPGGVMDISIIDGNHQIVDYDLSRQMGDDNSDELVPKPNPNPPKPLSGSATLPKKVTVEMTINYDEKVMYRFERDPDKVKQHLDTIISLAQVRFHKPSLPFKIDIKAVEFKHHYITIEACTDYKLRELKRNYRPKKLMTWFGVFNPQCGADTCYTGMAEIGAACRTDGQAIGITMMRPSNFLTARTFGHEFGHNLGMWHDFDKRHEGEDCNLRGWMSYGSRHDGWSKCSNHDLHDWFIREGYTCLKSETESFVPFTMQAGWCIDYFGEYVNKRETVRGSYKNGEDCAHAAIKETDSTAAMYDTRRRQCTFVKEPIEKAGPNNGRNMECYIFLRKKKDQTPAPPKRVWDVLEGFCKNRRGGEINKSRGINGINSEEECAKAAVRDQNAKGAVWRGKYKRCDKVLEKITGGDKERGFKCIRFRREDEPSMTTRGTTTPSTTRGTRTYTTSVGWCVDSRGNGNWNRKKLRGNPRISSAEDCAKKVMEDGPSDATGAVFQTPGTCRYFTTEITRGDGSRKSCTCFVFN